MRSWIVGFLLFGAATGCGGSGGGQDGVLATSDVRSDAGPEGDASLTDAAGTEIGKPVPPENPWEPECATGKSWYTTQYFNAVLVLRDAAGRSLVVAAGRHGKYFPYFQKDAPWDNVLLRIDGKGYSAAGQRLAGFALGLDEQAGSAHLFFEGAAQPQDVPGSGPRDGRREEVSVLLDLHLEGEFHPPRFLGVDLPGGDGMPPAGITLRPVFLKMGTPGGGGPPGTGGGVARIGKAPDFVPVAAAGELEVSTITYFKDESGAFRYDYLCMASQGDLHGPFAYVAFEGHALHAEGPGGEMFEKLLSGAMKSQFTLAPSGLADGNEFGVPDDLLSGGGLVTAVHGEDVVLGTMTRELLCTEDLSACGLRESVK